VATADNRVLVAAGSDGKIKELEDASVGAFLGRWLGLGFWVKLRGFGNAALLQRSGGIYSPISPRSYLDDGNNVKRVPPSPVRPDRAPARR